MRLFTLIEAGSASDATRFFGQIPHMQIHSKQTRPHVNWFAPARRFAIGRSPLMASSWILIFALKRKEEIFREARTTGFVRLSEKCNLWRQRKKVNNLCMSIHEVAYFFSSLHRTLFEYPENLSFSAGCYGRFTK